MSMYSHRGMGAVPPGNARLNELLEQIRAEFDSQQRQSENFEHQSMALPSHRPCPSGHCAHWLAGMPHYTEKKTITDTRNQGKSQS